MFGTSKATAETRPASARSASSASLPPSQYAVTLAELGRRGLNSTNRPGGRLPRTIVVPFS
ncbi:MAG TPA: hypothetical protein VIQ76_08655 [Propionibacteriaceae bacterium]